MGGCVYRKVFLFVIVYEYLKSDVNLQRLTLKKKKVPITLQKLKIIARITSQHKDTEAML